MLVIAHLTDIHISSELDPILHRATEVGAAISSHASDADVIVIVVSGDISFSGTCSQFEMAEIFLRRIESRIRMDFDHEVRFVLTPGNHDCDFSGHQSVRDTLLKSIADSVDGEHAVDVINACTVVQNNFFNFLEKMCGRTITGHDRLRYQEVITCGDKNILFDCINLSWVSQIKERQIKFPASVIPEQSSEGNVVFSVMHHPFNWLHPASYREFRRRVRSRSNFVLSGHEHQWNVIETNESEAGECVHFEGAVLQCGDPETSNFVVIEVNLISSEYRSVRYQWQGIAYERNEIPRWSAMRSFQLKSPAGAWIFSEEFESYLCDLGIAVRVGGKTEVSLRDVFVFPDLECAAENELDSKELIGDDVISKGENAQGFVLLGDERSGRTSLLKYFASRYLDSGKFPVFLNSRKIKRASPDEIDAVIDAASMSQYGNAMGRYLQLPKFDRVLLLDDFDEIPIKSEKALRQLLSRLRNIFGVLVVSVSDVFDAAYLMIGDDGDVYGLLPKYRILPFGHLSRAKLIRKWVMLDSDEFLGPEERVRRIDELTKHIEAVMRWGVVPCYPVYLLTLLQAHKGGSPEQFKEGGLGYYYEYLISDSMLKSGVRKDELTAVDQYCARLAWEMRSREKYLLSIEDLRKFDSLFSADWANLDFKSVRESLVLARVISLVGDSVEFRYPHVFYFFIAKFISENFDQDELSRFVELSAEHLYVRSNANILVFLAHFASKGVVVDKIVHTLKAQFEGRPVARFALRNESVEEMLSKLPVIVYQGGDPELNREREAEARDAIGSGSHDGLADKSEDASALSLAARLTVVFKAIEILGQILRAQYSRIRRERRQEVIAEMLNAPLRALDEFYSDLRDSPESFVAIFEKAIDEIDEEKLTIDARRALAQKIVGSIVLGVTFSFVRRAAESVSADVLREDLAQVVQSGDDLGKMLVKLAVNLDGQRDLPRSEIERVRHLGQGSLIVDRIVQVLVVYRMYMFRTSFSDIRWAHDILGLSHGVKVRALLSAPSATIK